MPTFLRSANIKSTRKLRRCFACGEMIIKGCAAVEWVSVCDGSVFSEYLHPGCWNITDTICFKCGECGENDGYQECFIKECFDNGSECKGVKAWLELGKVIVTE